MSMLGFTVFFFPTNLLSDGSCVNLHTPPLTSSSSSSSFFLPYIIPCLFPFHRHRRRMLGNLCILATHIDLTLSCH